MGLFKKLNKGLKKTRDSMSGAINSALYGKNEIDDEFYDDLEEILVMADCGVTTSMQIVEELRDHVFKKNLHRAKDVKKEIKEIVADMLSGGEEIDFVTIPSVILVIGVNGVGKTTSIGKMANMFREDGKKVILGAADTFRAAAIDQLEIWAERAGVAPQDAGPPRDHLRGRHLPRRRGGSADGMGRSRGRADHQAPGGRGSRRRGV